MQIKRGRTSQITPIRILDITSVSGGGKTGLVWNSTNLTAYYKRELDATATAITLATMTIGTWATGGFVEEDATHLAGQYSLGLPNAAIGSADASTWVEVMIYDSSTGLGIAPSTVRIDLVAYDLQDATRLGLTALPNANAGATGGLSDLAIFGGTASAGGTNTITLAGGAATDNLYKYAIVQITGGTGAGQSRLIIDYVGSTKIATVQKSWSVNPDNTSVFVVSPFAVPAVVHSGVAQAGAASTITLQSIASATDNIYNGLTITLFSSTGAFQSRIIKGYVGSTKVATLDQAWTINPDSTSVYEIAAIGPSWSDVFAWNGTAVSAPATAGIPEVNVKNVANTAQTAGDIIARLGTPAGASISADLAEIEGETDGISAIPTNPLLTTDARLNDLDATISSRNSTSHFDTVIGTPTGASVSVDIAEIEGETDSLLTNVAAIPTTPVLTAHFDAIVGTPVVSISADIAEIEAETDGISAIPTNPLLTSDVRLNNLDATISSRLPTTYLISDNGTAQSGSATNIKLRAAAPGNKLTGQTVFVVAGTGIYQSSLISAYDTTTKDATTIWTTAPDNTSQYVVLSVQGGSSGSSLTAAQVWAFVGASGLSEDATLAAVYNKTQTSPIAFVSPFDPTTQVLKLIRGDAYTLANNRQIDLPVPGNVAISATTLLLPKSDGTVLTITGTGIQIAGYWYGRYELSSANTNSLAESLKAVYNAKGTATADSTTLTIVLDGSLQVSN